jgi:hypothetical protein
MNRLRRRGRDRLHQLYNFLCCCVCGMHVNNLCGIIEQPLENKSHGDARSLTEYKGGTVEPPDQCTYMHIRERNNSCALPCMGSNLSEACLAAY